MYQIAIDGPAGSGKSTVAKALAKKLNITYLDTGAMYRALTYYLLREAVDLTDQAMVANKLEQFNLSYRGAEILVDGKVVSALIRSPEIGRNVSAVAALKCVRTFMVDRQREIAKQTSIVLDGRDIGSVVLVDAPFKYFITAAPETRAKRRYDERVARGEEVNYKDVLEDLIRRDKIDSTRAHSPLVVAADAEVIDTTELTVDQVVELIYRKVADETKNNCR